MINTEARGERLKQMIDAAGRVFAREGYRAASVADIIAEAGVARGTFYLYFKSKQAAFGAVIDAFIAHLAERAADRARRPPPAPEDAPRLVRAEVLDWLRYFTENRALAAVLFQHGASEDPEYRDKCRAALGGLYARWDSAIAAHQTLGVTNPKVRPEVLRSALVGMFAQLVLDRIVRAGDEDLERLADEWLELVANGVFRRP